MSKFGKYKAMIHIFIGTKAQYIKTAPLLWRLDQERVVYNLIDTGQHAQLTKELRAELGIRPPDVFLGTQEDIKRVSEALFWFLRYFFLATFAPGKVLKSIFKGKRGICIIHGDTLSTLLSLYLAKRAGLAVAHIEAGLRSFNLLNPFPEEIIRFITMHFSNILFAPSDWAYSNLLKMRLKGRLVNLKVNINYESYLFSLKNCPPDFKISNYCLVTIHRTENILIRGRLTFIVRLLVDIAKQGRKVLFIMHKPTKIALKNFGLLPSLANAENILLSDLMAHNEFINALRHADFIITDGGSIQEESFYFGTPCLLMRKRTERQEGLGENVVISEFKEEKISLFLKEFEKYRLKKGREEAGDYPSTIILKELRPYA